MNNSLHPIERTAAAYADGRDLLFAEAMLRQKAADRLHDAIESGLRPVLWLRSELHSPQADRRERRKYNRSLGATHVDTDINLLHGS